MRQEPDVALDVAAGRLPLLGDDQPPIGLRADSAVGGQGDQEGGLHHPFDRFAAGLVPAV
jgi:hypothetical protein